MNSRVYLYDYNQRFVVNATESNQYLNGSHELDWQGVNVEKIRGCGIKADNVFFKECFFLLALDEEVSFEINNKPFCIMPEEVCIMSRNEKFDLNNPTSYVGIFFTVDINFLKKHFYDLDIDHLKFTNNYRVDDADLKHLILMIYRQALLKTPYANPFLNRLFEAFAIHYITHYSNYFETHTNLLMTTKDMKLIDEYILQNLVTNITSIKLAELLNMSNYTFLNEFKRYTGTAPHKYILSIKLELAKQMLQNSSKSITDIGLSLGFHDGSHFTKFFKKKMRQSPSNYRKTYRSSPSLI